MLRKIFDLIVLNGFEAADERSAERVVARYSRGNTMVQFGRYLNSLKTERLRANGDRAAARLERRARRAKL